MFAGVLAVLCLMGCATPRFEDGTKAAVSSMPCSKDNCGKFPDWF